MNYENWQEAKRLWRQGKDTHDIARLLGVKEAEIYNGMYLLTAKAREAA